MNFIQRNALLNHFFFLSYLVILLLEIPFLKSTALFETAPTTIFIFVVYLSYALIYLLPAILMTKAIHFLLAWRRKEGARPSAGVKLVFVLAVALTAATNILLFADARIFKIFGFHINGFVWNLVTTPGGIESMGSDNSTMILFAFIIFAFIVLQSVLLLGLYRLAKSRSFPWLSRPTRLYPVLVISFLLLTAGERMAYGLSSIKGYTPVLVSSQAFPGYLPCTFRGLAEKFGIKDNSRNQFKVKLNSAALTYPLKELQMETPLQPLNIVWLVAESWRWDMLDPKITPRTWEFAQRSHHFLNHYSGGNGTRMGLFSMFYGLHGPYWFDFLNNRRGPVLMDVLQKQNYQFSMFTSAKFSYPEFDKTLFASIPRKFLHDGNAGQGWERDRKNVTELLDFIENRDKNRPFMTFMFFESPHARYYFPDDSILNPDYLPAFNYATMNLEKDIQLIKNRYVNSCHHLDSQFARVLDFLEGKNLLKNTIVILTGDHGEEFMEKGRWGHGSTFVEEQVRIPLVLWIPGSGSGSEKTMTSHLDVVPTLLPFLGVKNPPEDYSLGYNLLAAEKRSSTVISDWSHVCYADSKYKISIPLKAAGAFDNHLSTRNDAPLPEDGEFMKNHQKDLVGLMHDLGRFKQK